MLYIQWYAGKCLIAVPDLPPLPTPPKKPITSFAAFASFHGVNTSTMADLNVPMWDHGEELGRDIQ